jgi:small subunit ribosomal protein S9
MAKESKEKVKKAATKVLKAAGKKKEIKEAKKKIAPERTEVHEAAASHAPSPVRAEPQVKVEQAAAAKVEKVVHKPKAQKLRPEALSFGTGRRKTAIAKVKLFSGSGEISINRTPLSQYVSGRQLLLIQVNKPLKVVDVVGRYDVLVKASGGGIASQAGAVSLGIARALIRLNPELKPKLKAEGLLTRDSRMKERKKYGRKKARKRFQYSKR